MNISPLTHPENAIGPQTDPFDQVILVVEGAGKVLFNTKTSSIKEGDMIFIPQGTLYTLTNANKSKGLRFISICSSPNIPQDAAYQKLSEEQNDQLP